jgi:hypothetical protein
VTLDPDIGVEVGQPLLGGIELGTPQSGCSVHDLPLKIGEIHHIKIDDTDRSDSRGCEVER